MGIFLRNWKTKVALAVLYTLAMALLPLAHTPPAFSANEELSAFALPDGTVPLICNSDSSKPDQEKLEHKPACAACQLMSCPGLPPNNGAAEVVRYPVSEYLAPSSRWITGLSVFIAENARSRAPPV